jgi:glycine/D-amino acid oxidase-like deaminating enzyme
MSEFPSQAQAVIIGGGVGGASIAYHLTLMGWKDIVIVERHELTAGSTWHSAGLVGQMRSDANLTRMMHYSTDLYRKLKAETGVDTSWREVGGVRLASSAERMEETKRLVGMARSFGVPMELISPKEAQDMFPLMDIKGVVGAAYTPNDGSIDPTGLTNALAAGAKNRGAKILTNTNVEKINLKNGRVSEVVTDKGAIKTEVVVNASGMWGREVGKMVGLNLPVVPMAHLYIMTKPIEGVTNKFPNLRDPDLLVYWREEVGGLITGGYERQPATFGLDGIPRDFKYQLLNPDWDRFSPLMENSIRRVPAIENAEVVKLLNGPEGFTPDGEFLLGPTSVKGFWVACAYCAHGLAGAGGIGKVMAEWIIDGSPEWDMWRLDVRRFGPNYNSLDYTVARTFETYTQYYDIHFPGEERMSRRNVRTSPTYFRLRDLGCHFGEKMGWERPNWFKSYEELATHGHEPKGWARHNWSRAIGYEHLMTREHAGLFDETSFNKFEVRGPGALKFLNHVCANQIDVPVGEHRLHPMPEQTRRHRMRFHRDAPRRGPLLHRHGHGVRPARHVVAVAADAGGRLGHAGGRRLELRVSRHVGTEGAQDPRKSDNRRRLERRFPLHDIQTHHGRRRSRPRFARDVRRRTRLGVLLPDGVWTAPLGYALGGGQVRGHGGGRIQSHRHPAARKGLPLLERRDLAGLHPLRGGTWIRCKTR